MEDEEAILARFFNNPSHSKSPRRRNLLDESDEDIFDELNFKRSLNNDLQIRLSSLQRRFDLQQIPTHAFLSEIEGGCQNSVAHSFGWSPEEDNIRREIEREEEKERVGVIFREAVGYTSAVNENLESTAGAPVRPGVVGGSPQRVIGANANIGDLNSDDRRDDNSNEKRDNKGENTRKQPDRKNRRVLRHKHKHRHKHRPKYTGLGKENKKGGDSGSNQTYAEKSDNNGTLHRESVSSSPYASSKAAPLLSSKTLTTWRRNKESTSRSVEQKAAAQPTHRSKVQMLKLRLKKKQKAQTHRVLTKRGRKNEMQSHGNVAIGAYSFGYNDRKILEPSSTRCGGAYSYAAFDRVVGWCSTLRSGATCSMSLIVW